MLCHILSSFPSLLCVFDQFIRNARRGNYVTGFKGFRLFPFEGEATAVGACAWKYQCDGGLLRDVSASVRNAIQKDS
jgi:hypothetical protein